MPSPEAIAAFQSFILREKKDCRLVSACPSQRRDM
jgi:hypothetical protein